MPQELIAIVSEVAELTLAEIGPVAAALQRQVDRDFGPIWNVAAKVIAADSAAAAPQDAWLLTIKRHGDDEQPGVHSNDAGLPWASIEYSEPWSFAASHELLEMLVDPLDETLRPGPSPIDGTPVHFLVEVCDPCEEAAQSYAIDGVTVSDFITPAYYRAGSTGACSFTGSVGAPFEVLEGGYVTWQVPETGVLWQWHWPLGAKPEPRQLGTVPDLAAQNITLREWVDAETLRLGMPGSPHPAAPPAP